MLSEANNYCFTKALMSCFLSNCWLVYFVYKRDSIRSRGRYVSLLNNQYIHTRHKDYIFQSLSLDNFVWF